jgi:hypothetical protein
MCAQQSWPRPRACGQRHTLARVPAFFDDLDSIWMIAFSAAISSVISFGSLLRIACLPESLSQTA